MDDFVSCYNSDNPFAHRETAVFKPFVHAELINRDKAKWEIFRPKDESVKDSANLPDPDLIATENAEDLDAALDQFSYRVSDLEPTSYRQPRTAAPNVTYVRYVGEIQNDPGLHHNAPGLKEISAPQFRQALSRAGPL